jgi:hypothetical protein
MAKMILSQLQMAVAQEGAGSGNFLLRKQEVDTPQQEFTVLQRRPVR